MTQMTHLLPLLTEEAAWTRAQPPWERGRKVGSSDVVEFRFKV